MHLEDLGWNAFFETQRSLLTARSLAPARVSEEFRRFLRTVGESGEFLAEVAGRVRYEAEDREDLPAVGDWVGIVARPGENRARIECILQRRTVLSRKAAGRGLDEQIIAANLDVVFIVAALNREFNVRRIERYLAIVWDSGARPVVLLNKADLCPEAEECAAEVERIALGTPVHLMSAAAAMGLEAVGEHVRRGETAAFVGSSGVGKSTIVRALTGAALPIRPVRAGDDRGRHATTSRQMLFLPGGGIVIDTPGMRELQLLQNETGVARTFGDIATLAERCRFRDCAHNGEPGCAVHAAIGRGELQAGRLESHRKLQAELAFQDRKMDPEAARALKEKWKKIHKAMRHLPEKF